MDPSEAWVESKIRREYLEWRFRAHKNLVQILRYSNAQENPGVQNIDFDNVGQYAQAWGENTDHERREAILQRDSGYEIFPKNDGSNAHIILLYLAGKTKKDAIKRAVVKERLINFLALAFQPQQLSEDAMRDPLATIQQGKTMGSITMNINLQIILYSELPLETSTVNELNYYNELVTYPIRHFTMTELQYNPTLHRTGPKLVRVLNPGEVDDLIDRQLGLSGAEDGSRLGEDLIREYEEGDPSVAAEKNLKIRLRNLALSKLPTINSNDPWVKWRGYKLGDILYIERRTGLSNVTYRMVVQLSRAALKKNN